MKIAHILYSGLGGHGNVFFSMVKAAENTQFDFEAIFAGVEEVRDEYVAACRACNVQWTFVHKTPGLDINFNKNIIAAIKTSKSSIIFLHGSRFFILAKLGALVSKNKKKIVVRETQPNHLKSKADWVGLIFALLFADKMVFLTERFRKDVQKKLNWIYPPQKVSVINNGIDLNLFKPAEKIRGKLSVIGMQSRIMQTKDHAILLHAFAAFQHQYPDCEVQLKIAGDGELMPAMQKLAEELKISDKIEFTGMLTEVDLVNFLQSLDIYIHASLGETMSTAIMQAMACKLPIIASDVPGISNMIENDKTGILVPAKNSTALADAIYTLISNPEKATALKEAAFDFAILNYSNKTMFAKYEAVFKSLVIN
jgi:glycosyltransferase involved in cell wall biosynthesis